ncbi:hypothetical protein BASA60_000415 [Batrachochytrium salamandrivorans]|nr:hypothetical protein BASA60_000415 [Batrachochytrium salamandrivorans]
MGGKYHLKLNTGERPIANKYREGKMKRTLRVKQYVRLSKGRRLKPNNSSWPGQTVPANSASQIVVQRGTQGFQTVVERGTWDALGRNISFWSQSEKLKTNSQELLAKTAFKAALRCVVTLLLFLATVGHSWYPGCPETFTSVSSYEAHIRNCHQKNIPPLKSTFRYQSIPSTRGNSISSWIHIFERLGVSQEEFGYFKCPNCSTQTKRADEYLSPRRTPSRMLGLFK